MMRKVATAALAAGTLAAAAPALADAPPAGGTIDKPAGDPPSTVATIAALQAQVDALRTQLEQLRKQVDAVQPSWRGAPQFAGDGGFTFKPKGFLQFDAGYVDRTVHGRNFQKLGWGERARRLVIGLEGTLPGGFGYNAEFNFAQATVGYEDVFLSYRNGPLVIRLGNTFPLGGLDLMTSSRLTSFLERASLTEAFGGNRRLGLAVGLVDPDDRYTLTAGVYGQEIDDGNDGDTRTGWQASVRGTFSPEVGTTRLHLGANYQHRVFERDAQQIQYRSRPFTQTTGQRLIDTGAIAAAGDDIVGAELAAVHGPLHAAFEAQRVWVRAYQPGARLPVNDATKGAFYVGDPDFFSAYGEVGFYLTGETRGYQAGRWDRTKVLHPFDKGGWGALQINGRVDYVNLDSRVGPGANLSAAGNDYFINGGRQIGYELSLIWNPIDYVRLMAQFARSDVRGGPRTAAPGGGGAFLPADQLLRSSYAARPIDERDFHVDSLAVRAQVEF